MKPKREYSYRQVAFPAGMKNTVDKVCKEQKCSFSAFVQQAVEKALERNQKGSKE